MMKPIKLGLYIDSKKQLMIPSPGPNNCSTPMPTSDLATSGGCSSSSSDCTKIFKLSTRNRLKALSYSNNYNKTSNNLEHSSKNVINIVKPDINYNKLTNNTEYGKSKPRSSSCNPFIKTKSKNDVNNNILNRNNLESLSATPLTPSKKSVFSFANIDHEFNTNNNNNNNNNNRQRRHSSSTNVDTTSLLSPSKINALQKNLFNSQKNLSFKDREFTNFLNKINDIENLKMSVFNGSFF
jgi:hypothetical protein